MTILLPNDFIKTSVKPTSPNHHQSVIKAIRFEKKIKTTKNTPNNIQVKTLTVFIIKQKTGLIVLNPKFFARTSAGMPLF